MVKGWLKVRNIIIKSTVGENYIAYRTVKQQKQNTKSMLKVSVFSGWKSHIFTKCENEWFDLKNPGIVYCWKLVRESENYNKFVFESGEFFLSKKMCYVVFPLNSDVNLDNSLFCKW